MSDVTLFEAATDQHLLGVWLGPPASWASWLVLLKAMDGIELDDAELALFRAHTGRTRAPTEPIDELWAAVGRRGGKSRIASLIAVHAAALVNWQPYLAPGEEATVALIASDRDQARVCLRYCKGALRSQPMLAGLVVADTTGRIELANRSAIEIFTASSVRTRGYSFACVIGDEIAFWPRDGSADPDSEIIAAIKPGMAGLPGARLVAISSVHSRSGELWRAHREFHGRDDAQALFWAATSREMNPTLDQRKIEAQLARDPARASADWLSVWRTDVEGFIDGAAIEACVQPGLRERPPMPGQMYFAHCDPSGGRQDSMTLAIAHAEGDVVVLDLIREVRAPFNPASAVLDFSETIARYGLSQLRSDRYGAEWVVAAFRDHRVTCQPAEMAASDYYRELLPLINSRRVILLDDRRLIAQLESLERRVGALGKDQITHPPMAHDDIANSAAAALVAASRRPAVATWEADAIVIGRFLAAAGGGSPWSDE